MRWLVRLFAPKRQKDLILLSELEMDELRRQIDNRRKRVSKASLAVKAILRDQSA